MSTSRQNPSGQGSKWPPLIAVTLAFSYTFLTRFIWTSMQESAAAELGIDIVKAAGYMSVFFAGYLITQLPGGVLADRFQPKYILMTCTLLAAGATASMSLVQNYQLGLVVRIITGIASGCVMASCSKVVAINFSGHQRATGMGILLAAPPVGILLANQIGPRLNVLIGWRNTFLVTAGIGVVLVLLLAAFVKKVPTQAGGTGAKTGLLEGLARYFKDPQQLIMGFSGFMFMFVNVGFATWAMKYSLSLGFTPIQGGQIITLYSIAGVIASCLSGGLARKLKLTHKKFLIVSLLVIGVVSILYSLPKSYGVLIVVAVLYGFCSYLPSTHYTTIAMMRAGDSYAASAAASQNFIFQSSGLVQPLIIGAIIAQTGKPVLTWYVFAGLIVVAALLCSFTKEHSA